jgi:hypothetical protein
MKIFAQKQVVEARIYALAGGQALHLFAGVIADAIGAVRKIPNCFRGRKELGHLFDKDADRLRQTARRLGVRVVVIHHAGGVNQHVDLCGGPLERAKEIAAKFAALIAAVDDDAKGLFDCVSIDRLHCRRCARPMVAKASLEKGVCLWCEDFPVIGHVADESSPANPTREQFAREIKACVAANPARLTVEVNPPGMVLPPVEFNPDSLMLLKRSPANREGMSHG